MDQLLLTCLCFMVPSVLSLYQTYDHRSLGYVQPVYAPTYRQAIKPRYDYVSRPSFDYSITYGYQPTVQKAKPPAKSSFVSAYTPYQAQAYQPPTYGPSYTVSTGGYSAPKQSYPIADHYGYQTRTTYQYAPSPYGGVQRYGREGKDGESYEFTSYEDFSDSNEDRNAVDVKGYKSDLGKSFGMEDKGVSSRDVHSNPTIVTDDGVLDRVDSVERTADPCEDLDEGDYPIERDFVLRYPGVDAQCNFVKCSGMTSYLQPCGTGAKNSGRGQPHPENGFCGYKDFRTYCGYASVYRIVD